MNLQSQVVVLEVLLHLMAIEIKCILTHDGQATTPSLIEAGHLRALELENAIQEREVMFDLLVILYVKAIRRVGDRSLEV